METEKKHITLQELLKDDCVHLPIKRKENENYLDCLIRVVRDGYFTKLQKIESSTAHEQQYLVRLQHTALKLCDTVIECVRTYYSGNVGEAYQLFKATLDEISGEFLLDRSSENENHSGLFVKASSLHQINNLYRIRLSPTKLTERKELFHIPMSNRENVVTQRFSIEGNPSLYLGSTLFICWKESNLPNIWNCHASRYEIKDQDYVFLDIRNWLPKFRKSPSVNDQDKRAFYDHLAFWPLIAACSVQVSFDDKPFKPEYIIPQFLYQYTSELKFRNRNQGGSTQKVLGLLYSSTRMETWENFDPETEYNIAIPVHQNEDEIYSKELRNALWLTKPVSWKEALEQSYTGSEKENNQPSAEHYFYNIGQSFFRIEDALTKEPAGEVE